MRLTTQHENHINKAKHNFCNASANTNKY